MKKGVKGRGEGLPGKRKGGDWGSVCCGTLYQAAHFYACLTLSSYITVGALVSLAEPVLI